MKKRWCVWHRTAAIPEDQLHTTSFVVEGRDLFEAISQMNIKKSQARDLLKDLKTHWTDRYGDRHELYMNQEQ